MKNKEFTSFGANGRLNHPEDLAKHFSFKTFKDFLADKDSPLVYCTLILDGKDFLDKSGFSVELSQKTNDHDSFSVKVPDNALDSFEGYILENSKNLLGKNIIIRFHRFGEICQRFTGVISEIDNEKENGYGTLNIKGFGSSILLDGNPNTRSFESKTLGDIVKEVGSRYPDESRTLVDHPNTSHLIPYVVQYKESDYQFVKRLAIRYGEYFYYNGQQLIFGNKVQPIIELTENVDLINAGFRLHILPQHFSYQNYDPENGESVEKSSKSAQIQYKENTFHHIAVNASNKIFPDKGESYFAHTSLNATDKDLSETVQRQREKQEHLIRVSGSSRNPELKIGSRAKLIDINNRAMETYRILEIKHYHDGNTYYNEFKGIPDIFVPPYFDSEAFTKTEAQTATVTDNNDPNGMGRIRVQFEWQKKGNQKTPWISFLTLHGGAGKGSYFVPEIGERVKVSFEGDNAERPFVMGTEYNGKEVSGYATPGNDIKAIKTRSGIENISNDAEGSWKQSTPDGNFLHFDGQGNATLNVPKDLTINVGDNLNINVGKNISFLVGLKAIYNIGIQMMMNTPILKYFVSDNYHLQSPKTLINGDGEIKIEAKETSVATTEKLMMHSEEIVTVNSKGTVHVKGQEGTNHTNIAETFTPTDILLDATCIVQFRPKSNWKGEFGFDWFRIGDTGFKGDTKYETLVGQYYTKAVTDPTTARNIDINSWTRFFQADPQPTVFASFNRLERLKNLYGNYQYSLENDSSGNPVRKRYYRPYITLFPQVPDSANPRKFLEKGEAELELYLEFQKIDGKEVKPDLVIFEVDGAIANNSHSIIRIDKHTIPKDDLKKKIDITITCNATFDTDKDINIFTIMLDEHGDEKSRAFSGVLRMIAPSKQMTKDIVIVRVQTKKNKGKPSNFDELKRNLRQALIIPNIVEKVRTAEGSMEDIILDVRDATKNYGQVDFNNEYDVVAGNINKKKGTKQISIEKLLNQQLKRIYGNIYDNHFKLFFIDNTYKATAIGEDGGSGSTAGYSDVGTDFGIMYGTHNAKTIGHETLHGLGLYHTFSDNLESATDSKFIYKALVTDNIMDYSENEIDKVTMLPHTPISRISSWYWQWKIVNPNIN